MPRAAGPLTLADAVAFHAATRPDASAFVCDDSVLTFGALDARASRVANGLRALGVRAGHRVAYLGKNATEVFEVAIAAMRIGAVFTPLNWRLAAPEVATILADAAAPVLFVGAEFIALGVAILPGLPRPTHLVALEGSEFPAGCLAYAAWRDGQPATAPRHPAHPSDVALQIYTSGTTGSPKGVMLTHRNLRSLAGLEAPATSPWPAWNLWHADDVSLITAPLFHIGGLGWSVRGLFPGCTQIVMREFVPSTAIELMERHRVTRTALVPAALQMVLREPRAASADFSALTHLYYGASPIASELLREALRVFRCGFVQSYGQTETTSAIVALAPEDHTLDEVPHMKSAGRALPGVELAIADEAGRAVPAGTVGEIVTRSPANMAGYANLPEETAAVLAPDGWLRTGDAGRLDENGYLYVHDRIKEMIITGGENVYPAEVESALYAHPAVSEVAVIGVPSAQWGQAVKAIVVLHAGQVAGEAELIAWARTRIGGYKLPKSIAFVDALPRNPAGKVVKGELRRMHGALPNP